MPGPTSTIKKKSAGANTPTATTTSKQQKRSSDSTSSDTNSSNKMGANPHGHPPGKKWAVNDKVLCRYLHAENIYYEAKIMFTKDLPGGVVGYGIHYPGWSSRHDEVIPHHDALIRFRNYSEDEAARAKEEIKRAQQLSSAKKRKLQETKGIRAADEGSRSSTPASAELSNSAKRKSQRPTSSTAAELGGGIAKKDIPQVLLPDTLRRILIDDENLVNKQFMLAKLPARVTVFDIVQKYRASVTGGGADASESGGKAGGGVLPREFYIEYSDQVNALLNPSSECLERSALGLLDYFETAIGTILLYKFERPAFNDLVAKLDKQRKEQKQLSESEQHNKGAASELETNKPSSTSTVTAGPNQDRICLSKQFGLAHLLRMFVRFADLLAYTEWNERSLEAIIRHAQDFVMFLSKNHADFYNAEQDYVLAPTEYHKRVWGNQA